MYRLARLYFWWDTKALGLQSKLDCVWQQKHLVLSPASQELPGVPETKMLSPLARTLKRKTEAKLRLAGGEKNLSESLLRRRELSTFPP